MVCTLRADSHLDFSTVSGVPRRTTLSTIPIPASCKVIFVAGAHWVISHLNEIVLVGLFTENEYNSTEAYLHSHVLPILPSMWILLGHPEHILSALLACTNSRKPVTSGTIGSTVYWFACWWIFKKLYHSHHQYNRSGFLSLT